MSNESILSTPKQTLDLDKFKTLAEQIPDEPEGRLHSKTSKLFRSILDGNSDEKVLIDAHSHAFTFNNIPSKFLAFRGWLGETLVKFALLLTRPDFLKPLNLDKPEHILHELLRIYSSSSAKPKDLKQIFLCLLMMDMERGIGGKIDENFDQQVTRVCKLAKDYHFNENGVLFDGEQHLLPFIAIDPHNPDARDYFLSAFINSYSGKKQNKNEHQDDKDGIKFPALKEAAPFVGIKIYPALGYVPYHPVLMDIFEVCEAKKIPVTTHSGGHRTHPSHDKIIAAYRKFENGEWVDKEKEIVLSNDKLDHYTKFFLHPHSWEPVLKAFPDLRLNLAHLGSNDEWLAYRKHENSRVHQTFDLIERYENVYADFSYSFYLKVNISAIYSKMYHDDHMAKRIIYGSDYYLCEVEKKGSLKDYYANICEIFNDDEIRDNLLYKNAIRFLIG